VFDPVWILYYLLIGSLAMFVMGAIETETGRGVSYAIAFMLFVWPIGILWLIALFVYRGFWEMVDFTREVTK
jgi:hypothetical protein